MRSMSDIDYFENTRLLRLSSGDYSIAIKTNDGLYLDAIGASFYYDENEQNYAYTLRPFFYPFNYSRVNIESRHVVAEARPHDALITSYVELVAGLEDESNNAQQVEVH